MATSMADLGFNIDSKPMKRATTELNKMSGAAGKAEKSSKGLERATSALKTAMVGLVGAISAREVIRLSDTWRSAENQLKQVTSSTGELVAIQSQLVDISKETRSNFESTANLYARLARSTTALGLSQSDLLGITTTINQSFAASGATATEAAAAITQLSQGLASGALRGDEFNSVAEQAPAIMRAIASSLNMTTGELRDFAAEGGITAEIVVNALQKASGTIANDFGQTVATFGQSMEIATTNMLQFVGTSSTINDAVSSAGDAVVWLSENIDTLTAATAGLIAAGLAGYMISASGALTTYQVVMKGAIATQIAFNAVAAINPYVLIGAAIVGTIAALAAFNSQQESVIDVWNRARESESAYEAALKSSTTATRIKELTEEIEQLKRVEKDAFTSRYMRDSAFTDRLIAESELNQILTQRALAEQAQSAREVARNKSEAEAKQRQIDLEKTLADAKLAAAAAEQKKIDAAKAQEMSDFMAVIDDELSQLIALKDAYGDTTKAVRDFANNAALLTQMFNLTGNEEYIRMIERMAEDFNTIGEDSGKESAEKFVNEWQSVADSVASSLQNAIAAGDWKTLGDGIGNALATSASSVISKTITDKLSQNLTADSGALAQIGAAFAGPIAGAVAGAAIQIAVSELMDYLSDDWDPTEARQRSQGTGTVLGSINAKSESIAEATEATATASEMLIGINRDMLRALLSLQAGISGATARVARGAGNVSMQAPQVKGGADFLSSLTIAGQIPFLDSILTGAFEFVSDIITTLNFGLLDWDKLLGGRVKKRDEGIQIIGGYMTDLIDETIVNAFQTFRVKKHVLDDYDTKEVANRIGGDVERQFALVFGSIFDSVETAATALGVDATDAMNAFQIQTQKISLEGLDAAAQQAELEAYFGTVFDNLAEATVPFLTEFQKAGEGLGETLARVANEVAVTQEVVTMLGGQFSQLAGAELAGASNRLVDLSGGIEQFINSTQGFINNFASDARQFEITALSLSKAMNDLPLPDTRQGFFDLMSAQDAATQEGSENIATLLRLQSTADNYYDTIEKAQEKFFESEISGQKDRLSEAQRAQSAVESALGNMILDSRDVQAASRSSAIASLEQMARSGRVRPSDSLDRNLSAATSIQASDFSTFGEYVRDYTRTTSTLVRLKEITDEQVTVEQRMLDRLEKQLEAVQGLREDLEISQLAIIKQNAKTAGILERMELDGIEIRE